MEDQGFRTNKVKVLAYYSPKKLAREAAWAVVAEK